MLDLSHDDFFLMKKGFANDILKIVPEGACRNIMTSDQGRGSHGLASNDLVLDMRAQVNRSSFGHDKAAGMRAFGGQVVFRQL